MNRLGVGVAVHVLDEQDGNAGRLGQLAQGAEQGTKLTVLVVVDAGAANVGTCRVDHHQLDLGVRSR